MDLTGAPLEIRLREGHIEIESAPLEVALEKKGCLLVAVPQQAVPPLASDTVEESRRQLRQERSGN